MANGPLKMVGAKAMQPASPITKLIPKAGPGAKAKPSVPATKPTIQDAIRAGRAKPKAPTSRY